MLSTPKRPYYMPFPEFIPVRLVGLAIFNEKYDKTGHNDLKEVNEDAVTVKKIFERLGIKDTKILWNVNHTDLD